MTYAARIIAVLLVGAASTLPVQAAGLKVGIVAPQGDASFAVLGNELRQGFRAYDAGANHAFSDIVEEPETCDGASGTAAAKVLVAAGVDAAVGFFCPESLTAALPILSKAGIVTLATSVRADIVMEDAVKHGWPFFRLAPHAGAEIARIVDVISKDWAGEPFAIVEDGTIYGRETAESVRVALEGLGITPAFIDTYRPAEDKQYGLVRRLQRAGVTHAFVGGDRSDIAIIAHDSAALHLNITFMGGDAMKAADDDSDPLPDGVLAVATPEPQALPAARSAVAALKKAGVQPYGYTIPGFAAAQLLDQAGKRAAAGKETLSKVIANGSFDTALGPIRFGADHERMDNPFRLMVWQDDAFADVTRGPQPSPPAPAK